MRTNPRAYSILTADIPVHPLASFEIGREIDPGPVHRGPGDDLPGGHNGHGRRAPGIWAVSRPEMLDKIKDKTEVFEIGTITGITGSIMNECRIRNMPASASWARQALPSPTQEQL